MGGVARSIAASRRRRMIKSPITIRSTTADDVPAMAELEARAFGDPWPAASFRDLLRHPFARVQSAVDESGRIVGYCVMLRAADEAEIANIATDPGMRRRGVGARLLDDAIEASESLGVLALFLEVREANVAARALYASRAFHAVGRRRAYYKNPLEDALVLRRDVPAFK